MAKTKVFISYSHKDDVLFPVFLENLTSQAPDWDTWWDAEDIGIGTDWFKGIENAIEQSDAAIFLISPNFLSSRFIKENEFKKFNELKKNKANFIFIPVLLEDCDISRWKDLSDLQFFPAKGDDYEVTTRKKGTLMPFADLCKFFDNGKLKPNSKIATYFLNLYDKAQTDIRLAKATAEGSGKISEDANEIDKLRNLKNIFISLPASEDGKDIRKDFIISVEGKLKYDTPKWPYEITPGINEAKEILDAVAGDPEKLLLKLPDKFIYSILIIGAAEDLRSPLFTKQFELAKRANVRSDLNHTILWFLNSTVKDEIEKLDEAYKMKLKMLPTVVGVDAKSIFRLIDEFDKLREKKIKELTAPFSPVKKIYMFYDYTKDNENELRIKLKMKIQEDKNYAVRDLSYDTIENEKKEIEECNGAVIFYGSNSDSIWYKIRERIILKAKNIKSGAVFVDGKEEPEIEKKIDRDVSVTEIISIKGAKELDSGITIFKTRL